MDAHKYVFGRRAVVYGEEDLVVGLTAFLAEIGVQPVLCASGGESGRLEEAVKAVAGDAAESRRRAGGHGFRRPWARWRAAWLRIS